MPDSKALTILKNIKTEMEAEAVFNPVISGVETYSNAPVMDSRPTDNTPSIRILLAPGEWSFEEFSDWGTGELVGTLTCEAYVLVRCINPVQHDLAVYWAEQILSWVQYRHFDDTLSVTKAGGMEPITILDPQEDPDITRREMRVWFSMAASPTAKYREPYPLTEVQELNLTNRLQGLDFYPFGEEPILEWQEVIYQAPDDNG